MNERGELPSVDVHTHVGVDYAFFRAGWWPYAATAQDLLERLDRYGIDQAVCFPFVVASAFDTDAFVRDRAFELIEGRFPFDYENPRLVTEIEWLGAQDRLLPLAFFDPGRRVAEQVAALEGLADRVAGLKAQTEVLRSPIRDLLGEARDILEIARSHDLPVLFHTSVNPNDQCSQVRDCLDVAEAWPDVRFNLAHSLRFDREGLERAAALPNVWVDCSAHVIHCRLAQQDLAAVAPKGRRVDADYSKPAPVLEAIHAILGDAYMWGSDAPFNSWCDDGIKLITAYSDEIEVLDALPAPIRDSMLRAAPHAWLHGKS
ncbi:MAG: amidohydrolase family protein [Phycisphaeraceae bacterium]